MFSDLSFDLYCYINFSFELLPLVFDFFLSGDDFPNSFSEIASDFFDILFHVFCFLMNIHLIYSTISRRF